MVAITVILAAVIAAFVFNIGGTQSKTPVVSLTAVSASSSNSLITINHAGGDPVDLNKVKAIIEQGTSRNTIGLLNATGTQYLYTGDKLVINESTTVAVLVNNLAVVSPTNSTNSFALAPGVVTVTLIDTTSSQQIASITASAS
jgi:FlaG/FlaF family flagellin (archaellin)